MLENLKWYYDKNLIFPIEAILKHKQVVCLEEKCCLLFSNIFFCSRDIQVFKICKLAKWWHHTLNQILIKYDEKKYLNQVESEMLDSLPEDSTKYAPHYQLHILCYHKNVLGSRPPQY